ncbi:glycosyltransferase family 4 protein [Thermoleophilia bacterium SCSIO 60948]|nr:glycosyltransferase family 4 protein [Thermoleophilia bacterium SCSIO 60948]
MRVLIFHAFLLRGTGSNVYNASLAPALARLGHEVHLFSQDRNAGALGWIDREIVFDGTRPAELPDELGAPGTVTAWRPDIGGLLPVYVHDEYEGFRVKTYSKLTDDELDRYLGANVGAIRSVVRLIGGVDAALANHEVMGPAICAQAGLGRDAGGPGFAVKVHGSALEYTVKPEPERFLPYALEGMRAASGILVGSRHTAESLWTALDDPEIEAKTRLGPPGVDTTLFAPLPAGDRAAAMNEFAAELEVQAADEAERGVEGSAAAWGRDPARAARAISDLADASFERVVFVGKLIVSKGVDLLLAAWPLVLASNPRARLCVVGFGEYAGGLERLWAALSTDDLETARELARIGRGAEGGEEAPLRILSGFLADPPPGYLDAAAAGAGSVAFAGRLEHDEVARVVPACEAIVFPSTFPEAFGMVAAEAASAGVLPVSADHSGMAEVSRELRAALPPEVADLVAFPLGLGSVTAIAERLQAWLATPPGERAAVGEQLRETVARIWSWERVAEDLIAASHGDIDGLARVPSA